MDVQLRKEQKPTNTPKKIDHYNQGLKEIPSSIIEFKKLTYLSLEKNYITTIEPLVVLTELTELYLSHNQIKYIPDGVSKFSNLKKLMISNNQLTEFPSSLCHLSNLKILSLSKNQIQYVPEQIFHLSKLKELDISKNNIYLLPSGIYSLTKLKKIEASGNQNIKFPPKSVCDQGSSAVLKFLKQAKKELTKTGQNKVSQIQNSVSAPPALSTTTSSSMLSKKNNFTSGDTFDLSSSTTRSTDSDSNSSNPFEHDLNSILNSQEYSSKFFRVLQNQGSIGKEYLHLYFEIRHFKNLPLSDSTRSETAQNIFFVLLTEINQKLEKIRIQSKQPTADKLLSVDETEVLREGLKKSDLLSDFFMVLEERLFEKLELILSNLKISSDKNQI